MARHQKPLFLERKGDKENGKGMIVKFMQKSKPTVRQIWEATGRQNIQVTKVAVAKQPWELPIWTVEYTETRDKP